MTSTSVCWCENHEPRAEQEQALPHTVADGLAFPVCDALRPLGVEEP